MSLAYEAGIAFALIDQKHFVHLADFAFKGRLTECDERYFQLLLCRRRRRRHLNPVSTSKAMSDTVAAIGVGSRRDKQT